MNEIPALEALKQALRRLPGVGPKSAQRMAFHLLERDREGAKMLAQSLTDAVERVIQCRRCNNFGESELCGICSSPRRDVTLLCVVESPADLVSLDQAGVYNGMYFVLMGRLSPLDGIGPDQLGLPLLAEQLADGTVQELIIATNPTVEGEATAYYIAQMAKAKNLKVTRIAHGVPMGGELEYVDGGTIAHAFAGRQVL